MKSRHRARELALQILYRYDLSKTSTGTLPPAGKALVDDLDRHFEHFQTPLPLREFAAELVAGTLREQNTIDQTIEKHAANWKIGRMGFIDRNLIRMAIYEMSHFRDIPASVTINEAIELAKQFGTAESSSFINGILDSVRIGREREAQTVTDN